MTPSSVQLIQASDRSLLVSFGNEISLEHHHNILRLATLLLSDHKPFVLNLHPAYSSLLVSFDPCSTSSVAVKKYLQTILEKIESVSLPAPRTSDIPVCYGDDFGPDLHDVASLNHLSIEEVIRIHSSGNYLVYFLGFTPGFPYMGGLSEKIATPRLATPRTKVPAGSVAIGGNQTAIYPVSSPGGWRIIGRTPLRLFRPTENPPTLLRMGNEVRFTPIPKEEFNRLV